MDGKEMVKIIDEELRMRGWTQYQFCNAIGIRSSAMSAWRNGSKPKPSRIAQIEKCLGISFADYEKSTGEDKETEELLQSLKDRSDLRVLLNSAKDVPPSSVYALVAQLEKEKEDVQ